VLLSPVEGPHSHHVREYRGHLPRSGITAVAPGGFPSPGAVRADGRLDRPPLTARKPATARVYRHPGCEFFSIWGETPRPVWGPISNACSI
jgi:hypothetical protein